MKIDREIVAESLVLSAVICAIVLAMIWSVDFFSDLSNKITKFIV